MIRRLVASCVAVAALAGACGSSEPAKTSAVRFVSRGFSTRGSQLGVAVRVRVVGNRGVRGIRLQLNFLKNRDNFASDTETIPYCPPKRDCWWGKTYTRQSLLRAPRVVDEITVTVDKVGTYGGPSSIAEPSAQRRGSRVSVRTDSRAAVVVVLFKGRAAKFGWSGTTDPKTGSITGPGPRAGERARAFAYVQ